MSEQLPQELKDYVDSVVQDKIEEGMTHEQATAATIEWLNGLAAYIEKYR